jgi:hypothetical protein
MPPPPILRVCPGQTGGIIPHSGQVAYWVMKGDSRLTLQFGNIRRSCRSGRTHPGNGHSIDRQDEATREQEETRLTGLGMVAPSPVPRANQGKAAVRALGNVRRPSDVDPDALPGGRIRKVALSWGYASMRRKLPSSSTHSMAMTKPVWWISTGKPHDVSSTSSKSAGTRSWVGGAACALGAAITKARSVKSSTTIRRFIVPFPSKGDAKRKRAHRRASGSVGTSSEVTPEREAPSWPARGRETIQLQR